MAIIRNIDIKTTVATKPKETALTELSKLLQWSSLSTPPTLLTAGAILGAAAAADNVPIIKASENTRKEKLKRIIFSW